MRILNIVKVLVCVMVLSLSLSAGLMAQDGKGAVVGVIDLEKVVNESKDGKAKIAGLKAKYEKMQKDFKAQSNEIGRLEAELKKLSEAGKTDAKILQNKYNVLRGKMEKLQDDSNKQGAALQQDEVTALEPIIKKVREETQKAAKARGCVLVVDIKSAVYHDASIDLTDAVLKNMK